MNERTSGGPLTIPPGVTDLISFHRFLAAESTAVDTIWEAEGPELLLEIKNQRPKLFRELVGELTPTRCLKKILHSTTTTLSPQLQGLTLFLVDRIGKENVDVTLLERVFYLCPLTPELEAYILKHIPTLAGHKSGHGFPIPSVRVKPATQASQEGHGIDEIGGF